MSGEPGGNVRIELKPLFPTPVIIAQFPEPQRVNEALLTTIHERMAEDQGTQHSNLGGWQSRWDMTDWGGPAFAAVIAVARQIADRVTVERGGRPVSIDWKINAWANVNRLGHGNEFHIHPGALWSGTYYVDDGGIAQDASLGGEFEVQDPRGVAPVMYAPMLTYAGPGGDALGASETISPRAGTMVMFPSWLQHAVRPYRGTRERVSIAFNLSL